MGVSKKMVSITQQKPMGLFLLKMIMTWGGDWGYPYFWKHPYESYEIMGYILPYQLVSSPDFERTINRMLGMLGCCSG